MTTKLMEDRGIRTINVSIELWKKLMRLKVETDAGSLDSVIEYLYKKRQEWKIKGQNTN